MKQLLYAFTLDVSRASGASSESIAGTYAATHSTETFLSESLAVFRALEEHRLPSNDLTRALARVLVEEAGPFMENGEAGHFAPAHTETARVIAMLRSTQTPHGVTGLFQRILARVYPGSSLTVIQTPRRLDTAARIAMRRQLAAMTPEAYPTFAVDRALLGGMRLFVNGVLVDNSWQQKVTAMLRTLS